jgi:hypothetical protein
MRLTTLAGARSLGFSILTPFCFFSSRSFSASSYRSSNLSDSNFARFCSTICAAKSAAVAIDAHDFVHLRGAIAQPPSGTSNIAFVLPVRFRPLATLLVPIALFTGQPGALQVEPNGVVTVAAAGPFSDARAFTSLEGVSFPRK